MADALVENMQALVLIDKEARSLPENLKRRLRGVKHYQQARRSLEDEMEMEIRAIERKYRDKFLPLHDKLAEIITGKREPTNQEVEGIDMRDAPLELLNMVEGVEEIEGEASSAEISADAKGIPGFWLKCLSTCRLTADMVEDSDRPALAALEHISVSYNDEKHSYTLNFHFARNDYFENAVLTKEMVMNDKHGDAGERYPVLHVGGCSISWKEGKCLTEKTVTKTQRHRKSNAKRTVTRTVKCDSFFHFFDTPKVQPGHDEEQDEEEEEEEDNENEESAEEDWELHFEVAETIRRRILAIPCDYYTGISRIAEMAEEMEDYGDDNYYYGGEEEEDDDDEEDAEEHHGHGHHHHGHGGHRHGPGCNHDHGRGPGPKNANPVGGTPNCNQQ